MGVLRDRAGEIYTRLAYKLSDLAQSSFDGHEKAIKEGRITRASVSIAKYQLLATSIHLMGVIKPIERTRGQNAKNLWREVQDLPFLPLFMIYSGVDAAKRKGLL